MNKPAGLIVERNPFESPTVEELVYQHLEEKVRNPYLGIVHRLDRVTSGVLLFAKRKSALRKLNEQFRLRSVDKTYLAVVHPAPEESNQSLTHWLRKDQKNKRAEVYDKPADQAQKVSLQYRLLQREGELALLEVKPQSGKFHQIRAQLAFVGAPIVGDKKYGSKISGPEGAIALHAWKLDFLNPKNEERKEVIAPLPESFPWNSFR